MGRKRLGLAGHTEVCRTKEVLGDGRGSAGVRSNVFTPSTKNKSRTIITHAARARLCTCVCTWVCARAVLARLMVQVAEDGEKHSMIWRMFMTVTMESAVFMGKNYLNKCQSIANTTDLKLKQMFNTSTRVVSEQDEISGLETNGWENHGNICFRLVMKELSIFNAQKVYVFYGRVEDVRSVLTLGFPCPSCRGVPGTARGRRGRRVMKGKRTGGR